MTYLYGIVLGVVIFVVIMRIITEGIRSPRAELRKKKRDCIHEWHDAGKVGYDGARSLYCPICDESKQMSETTAKIVLNEVMIRKLHDGSRKEHGAPCTYKKDEWVVVRHDNGRNCTYPIAKPDPIQAALARNKKSQDDLTAAVQSLSDALDRKIARNEAAHELQRRLDKYNSNVR